MAEKTNNLDLDSLRDEIRDLPSLAAA